MWRQAKVEDLCKYQMELDLELSKIGIPAEAATCNEPDGCKHKHTIESYFDSICGAMLKSANRCILRAKSNCGRKRGWDEDLKKAKRVARKNYCLWRDAGRPRQGTLFLKMSESRKSFRSKLKSRKRKENELFCSSLVDAIDEKDHASFWKKLKYGIQPNRTKHGVRIEKGESEEEIMETWKRHFGQIINSEPPDNVDRERSAFEQTMREYMDKTKEPWWFVDIHPLEVEKAFRCLKRNKAAGPDMIETEHLQYGGRSLAIYLSVAMTSFLRHSLVPQQFLRSYIVPIVKEKAGDVTDTNNYRGFALSSAISKVLEHVFLERFRAALSSCEQQFGFKQGHGCAECSFVLREAIDYYLSNGNREVYVCALDLSKAYDRVSYYRLFTKLLRKGLPIYFVKFLERWYSSQTMQVKWGDGISSPVNVRNGVRQGSVLSPSLFNVYIDDLLAVTAKCGYGARFSDVFVGCLAYADDMTLISPTVNGMQKMLGICDEYARDHSLMFNDKKSVATTFVKNKRIIPHNPEFWLNGRILPTKVEIMHLGVAFHSGRSEESAISKRVRKFYGSVNTVVSRLGGLCLSDSVWMNIVDKQLFAVLDYGSHLWNFSKSSVIKSVNNAFRKGIRKGLGMKQSESICQRFPGRFTEATTKMKRQQLRSLKRATESKNRLVGLLSWYVCRHKLTCRGIDLVEKNIFITTYKDI